MPSEWGTSSKQPAAQSENRKQELILKQREYCQVTGVVEMISFDEKAVVADTVMGMLTIRGENLHVKRVSLEGGELEVTGTVQLLQYQGSRERGRRGENFIRRLVR